MQTIKLDLSSYEVPQSILAKQGDVGRKFLAKLTDSNREYTIPEGAKLSVWYSGTSGSGNYSMIGERSAFTVEGSAVTVEMITQMLQNKGGGTLCLMLHGNDGTQIAMWNIPYTVEAVPGMGSAAAQQYYTALSAAAANVERDAKLAQEAAVSAMEAMENAAPIGLFSHDTIYVNKTSESRNFWEQIFEVFDAMPASQVKLVQAIVISSYEADDSNEPANGGYRVTLTKLSNPNYGFVEAVSYTSDESTWNSPDVITRVKHSGQWLAPQMPMRSIYNTVKSELLWTNASRNSVLAPQTITLPERAKEYNAFLIVVNLDTSWYYNFPILLRKEDPQSSSVAYFPNFSYGSQTWLACWRYFFVGSDGGSVTISEGYRDGYSSNSRAIPYKIYGIML